MTDVSSEAFDVAIVGGGPAGLSAAIVLGRCRRRVILFDHGKPRNYAAQGVHCYLGAENIGPHKLRELGRSEARSYGVAIVDAEVVAARCLDVDGDGRRGFEIHTAERSVTANKLLLATGLVDELPEIPGLKELYGRSVHHCPYCDGWEHRDQHLVALGGGDAAAGLALSLRTWSVRVTALSNGEPLSTADRKQLSANGIDLREEKVQRLIGNDGALSEIQFDTGPPLPCEALFFSADKIQRSRLPARLGCTTGDDGLIKTGMKHCTDIDGLFLAGDADGDVQFAIVAAAEGATAATAINRALQDEQRLPSS